MNDPIVDEVRRIRDEHAARFHYDLDAIFMDIKEQEKRAALFLFPFPLEGLNRVQWNPSRTRPLLDTKN